MAHFPLSFPRRVLLAILAIAIVLAVSWLLPIDGLAHGGLLRLPGRLHPLLVHFPIALLLLAPLLEWAGRKRPALGEAAGFLLGLAVVCTTLAVTAGLALAHADGQDGVLLLAHFRGGVLLAIGTALAWLMRGRSRAGYALLLAATLGCLFWTAHNGGSLTHGSAYLTEPLPPAVKRAFRIPEAPPPEVYAVDTVFAVGVRPILEKHCLSCHGAEKQKGDYRMDTFAALLAGGKSGQVAIVPGDLAHSELIRRLALASDDEKLMPPRKKPRPTAGELAMLRWWVKHGASREMSVADAMKTKLPPEVAALLASPAGTAAPGGEGPYVPRVGDYAARRDEIGRLERALGIKLVPLSQRPGDGLILRVRGAEDRFGDAELAQLAPVAPFIVEAELAGTRLTDAGLAGLKPFSHLERLHLERTVLSGQTLNELQALPVLRYLNLCFTPVNDANVTKLAGVSALEQLYLFGSRVSPAGLTRLRTLLPRCRLGPLALPAESTPDRDSPPASSPRPEI